MLYYILYHMCVTCTRRVGTLGATLRNAVSESPGPSGAHGARGQTSGGVCYYVYQYYYYIISTIIIIIIISSSSSCCCIIIMKHTTIILLLSLSSGGVRQAPGAVREALRHFAPLARLLFEISGRCCTCD